VKILCASTPGGEQGRAHGCTCGQAASQARNLRVDQHAD
jgi:hypothetical protein